MVVEKYDTNLLVKIGDYQWLKRLIDYGEVYMRPLYQFHTISQPGMADANEGLFCKFNEPRVIIDGHKKKVLNASLFVGYKYPVYCCFHLLAYKDIGSTYNAIIPGKIINEFTQNCQQPAIVVFKKNEFIKQMQKQCGDKLQFGNVCYKDSMTNRGFFYKNTEYKYQQEFRFVFAKEHEEPKKVIIEPIKITPRLISIGKQQIKWILFSVQKNLTYGDVLRIFVQN